MASELITVAIRVRPFNQREVDRKAKCAIQMAGKSTTIVHPNEPQNKNTFSFNFSFWSHDGFRESHDGSLVEDLPPGRYVSQLKVFEELGRGILENTLNGYNCSLLAYGQTGSGKSYTMVGHEKDKGIMPVMFQELFALIESAFSGSKKFTASVSMLEIYNERIRDLLVKSSKYLEVRESLKSGFYVPGVEKIPVRSYKEVERRIIQGTANRMAAAARVNASSSRAHTVVSVELKQIISEKTGIITRKSTVAFIDLAGSEWAVRDRLKENGNVNRSITALGDVIAAFADGPRGSTDILVPYRDSVLTKMLKGALGGNSKTMMIATLSPADSDFDESLNTLRCVDKMKRIRNVPLVNEIPLEQLIRDLREENESLKMMLSGQLPAEIDSQNLSEEDIERMRREIEEELRADMRDKSELLEILDTSGKERVREAETYDGSEDLSSVTVKKTQYPFLSNLNEDAQLSGFLLHFIEHEEILVGKGVSETGIKVEGPGVHDQHAVLTFDRGSKRVTIRPHSPQCQLRVNGVRVLSRSDLVDLDRVLLGASSLYVFHHPLLPSDCTRRYDWQYAQSEIAVAEGFSFEENDILAEKVIEVLPMVNEVNAVATEMNKEKTFAVRVIPQSALDLLYGEEAQPRVVVKMTCRRTRARWLWECSNFINHRFIIQDAYQRFIEEGDQRHIISENDPFFEPITEVLIGRASAFLLNLSYNIGMEHSIHVIDYKGCQKGILSVTVEPCDSLGIVNDDDREYAMADTPNDLLGKPFYIKVSVISLDLHKSRFIHGSLVKFRVYRNETVYSTSTVSDTLQPCFNYRAIIELPTITKDHLEYFQNGRITFSVFGIQRDSEVAQSASIRKGHIESEQHIKAEFDLNRKSTEVRVLKALHDQQQLKVNKLKQICIEWASKPPEEQHFDPFYRSVASLAFSSGNNKFKIIAKLVGKKRVSIDRVQKNGNSPVIDGEDSAIANITISRKIDGKDVTEVCVTM